MKNSWTHCYRWDIHCWKITTMFCVKIKEFLKTLKIIRHKNLSNRWMISFRNTMYNDYLRYKSKGQAVLFTTKIYSRLVMRSKDISSGLYVYDETCNRILRQYVTFQFCGVLPSYDNSYFVILHLCFIGVFIAFFLILMKN